MNGKTRRASRGFTLIELMAAIALVAILIGIAAPSFREMMMSVRMTGATNDLMADIGAARSEAAKLNVPVYLCRSTDGRSCNGTSWNGGWIVFADTNQSATKDGAEPVIRMRPALATDTTIAFCSGTTAVNTLPYTPTGNILGGGAVLTFKLCDPRTTANAGRTITINTTGRPQVTKTTCSGVASC